MKTAQEIAFGFIIFFIIDRVARLISAQLAINRNMSDIETERLRCTIELAVLFCAFVFLKKCT